MEVHEIQMLQQGIQNAIADGLRDGFASNPVVTVSMPPLIDLRDFFAGCAMSGMWACSAVDVTPEKMAALAYHTADAMLLEKIGKAHA